uniref:Potassium/proton antiporter CemA n=1 Tax=Crepidomanes minutum TaxID=32127 RepID=A0A8K1RVJ2_9MONI|nr:chloroplast envelope membrane protein [Crepidomanes minutum]UEQ13200.1 chloroplast envelope membrane protein [Crepidomanes minutum]
MKPFWWKFLQWFYNTPYRSLNRAYKTSKQIQSIGRDSLDYLGTRSSFQDLSQAVMSHMNMELDKSIFLIYWSLLECRISLSIPQIRNRLRIPCSNREFFNSFCIRDYPYFSYKQQSSYKEKYYYVSSIFCSNSCNHNEKENHGNNLLDNQSKEAPRVISERWILKRFNKIKEMNKRLVWIEATLNDLDFWRWESFTNSVSLQMKKGSNQELLIRKPISSYKNITAYESISLIPRSITRTLARFRTELMNQSGLFLSTKIELAKYQALASIQYIGYLLFFPFIIPITLNSWFLEPWIRNWWNTSQSQIFINLFQEEKALKRLQEVEGLAWLNEMLTDSVDTQSQDYRAIVYDKTTQSVIIYNEGNIQAISRFVTDVISISFLTCLLIIGRKRLAVLNSWIQELFYSLNDTMKAFSILLLTDLCIGFHSPHGWEILIGSFLEHLGFAHNKYVISCFVSTFPVILDTVFKYWIFRHLNRISPSIVATYHTMNE